MASNPTDDSVTSQRIHVEGDSDASAEIETNRTHSLPASTAPSGLLPTFMQHLVQPVDGASLNLFRIALGISVAWYAGKSLSSGAVRYHFIDPAVNFTFYGFSWVQPWPDSGMYYHFAALLIAGVCFAMGMFYRLSSVLLFLTFTYVFLCERTLYNNHHYLMSLLAMLSVFAPLHRCWSIDVVRVPSIRRQPTPVWALWLIRFQLGIVYFYGGLAKLEPDWLQGQPMRMWLSEKPSYPVLGPYFTLEWVVQIFVWGGLLLDLFIVPLLLYRRTRPYAFALAVSFHLMNSTLFEIGVFPWLMIVATTIYFPPDWPRRLTFRQDRSVATAGASTPPDWNWRMKAGFTALAAYVLLQLVLPFRHFLIRSPTMPTSWTERSHLFSWRMMLRDKNVAIRFSARDPETGEEGLIDAFSYLSLFQVMQCARDPEHIRQLAVFMKNELSRQGVKDAEIRVVALASLNGRKPQLLIDPGVDLANESAGIKQYPWIMPLTEPLRHDAWDVPVSQWESILNLQRQSTELPKRDSADPKTPRTDEQTSDQPDADRE